MGLGLPFLAFVIGLIRYCRVALHAQEAIVQLSSGQATTGYTGKWTTVCSLSCGMTSDHLTS